MGPQGWPEANPESSFLGEFGSMGMGYSGLSGYPRRAEWEFTAAELLLGCEKFPPKWQQMMPWLLESAGWHFQSTASGFASEENERKSLESRSRTFEGQERVAGV